MASQMEIITVGATTLSRILYKGRPMLTVKQIAEIHGQPEAAIRKTFQRNRGRFLDGVDCLVANCHEGHTITGKSCPNGLLLFTESGYLKLVKSFGDNKAWEVHGKLMDAYFKAKQQALAVENPTAPITQIQLILQMAQGMAGLEQDHLALKSTVEIQHTETVAEIAKLKAKLDTDPDYYSAKAYANLEKKRLTREQLREYGVQATALSKERGVTVGKVKDATWGHVNTYRLDILKEVFV